MKRDFEELEDIQQKIQTIPEELPILPVRDAVIFPNAVIPLTVGRESSVKLINDVQQGDGMLVVLTQRDKRVDSPGPSRPLRRRHRQHGPSRDEDARRQSLRHHHGSFPNAGSRSSPSSSLISARKIAPLADDKEDESCVDFQALRRTVVSQFERIIKLSPQLPDDLQTIVINIEDSGRLADYIATNLPNLSIVSKQFVLEQISVRKRLSST